VGGVRCTTTTKLEVHHLAPGTKKVVPDSELTTVCHDHHAQLKTPRLF
jgi:hypothetical protein